MESDTTATVPESLSKAHDAFHIGNLEPLRNVFITFKNAALWEEKNPSDERPSWWGNLEDIIRKQTDSLKMTARSLTDVSGTIAPQSSQAEVTAACESFLIEVSKLFDLLAIFEVVGEDEDEGGHREEVHWPACFEILLDALKRIEEGSGKLWDILVEAPKRIKTGQEEANGKKQAMHYPRPRRFPERLYTANDELGLRIANVKDHIMMFTAVNLWNEDPSEARSRYSSTFDHMRHQGLELIEATAGFKKAVLSISDLPETNHHELSEKLADLGAEALRLQKLVHRLVAEPEPGCAAKNWPVGPEELWVAVNSVADKRVDMWLKVTTAVEASGQTAK
jgi:hypothetical protein